MRTAEDLKRPPKKGRPRLEDRDKTFEARKPWVAKGMSRSTWFRRRAELRAASESGL
jgi:hypothetical protein